MTIGLFGPLDVAGRIDTVPLCTLGVREFEFDAVGWW